MTEHTPPVRTGECAPRTRSSSGRPLDLVRSALDVAEVRLRELQRDHHRDLQPVGSLQDDEAAEIGNLLRSAARVLDGVADRGRLAVLTSLLERVGPVPERRSHRLSASAYWRPGTILRAVEDGNVAALPGLLLTHSRPGRAWGPLHWLAWRVLTETWRDRGFVPGRTTVDHHDSESGEPGRELCPSVALAVADARATIVAGAAVARLVASGHLRESRRGSGAPEFLVHLLAPERAFTG
jgi:hypothetical protein